MLPLYELVINDDDHSGVTAVALVDAPAIEVNFHAFSKQNPIKFQTFNNEKRIIAGFLMLANKRIYRNDERGEYDVFFSAPTIERIVNKYHKNQYSNRVNPMHESMLILPDIYMVSDFIIDSTKGINTPAGFDTQPDGSWFGMFKVNNDEIWNEYIKTGIFKGFSVEGFFEDVPVELSEADLKKLSGFLEHLN